MGINTLCAWLGKSDVREARNRESGPILAALKKTGYGSLLLLTCLGDEETAVCVEWIKRQSCTPIHLHHAELEDPTDFGAIYNAASKALAAYCSGSVRNSSLTFHLSPGTPAMGAVWIVLANSVYSATLVQAHRETGVREVVIPFEVTRGFFPQKAEEIRRSFERTVTDTKADEMFGRFDWKSPAMKEAIERARRLAPYNEIPVLILGGNGTGKEEMAKFIHRLSGRGKKVLEPLNCAAIPATLIEAELFGAAKGSATGVDERPGALERANGGTLFLDEIGDMPLDAQVKLLRALQEKLFKRVGGTRNIESDFRLICATNRDLGEMVSEGGFREDLYYRIAGSIVMLPALAERREDIAGFAAKQLEEINRRFSGIPGYVAKILGEDALVVLSGQNWRGNVRELVSVLKAAAVWGKGAVLMAGDITSALVTLGSPLTDLLSRPLGGDFSMERLRDELDEIYVRRAMSTANNNLAQAARLLNTSPQNLANWAVKFGLHKPKVKKRK